MSDHASIELIAAFREGLLEPGAMQRVGRHLTRCPACARDQAVLDEVTAELAGAPTPPMPPELARRLDAALAAEIEAAGHPAAPAAPRQRPAARERGRAGRLTRWVRRGDPDAVAGRRGPGRGLAAAMLRPLAAAAAVCLVAGGGYLLLHSLAPGGQNARSAAGSASSRATLPAGGAMVRPQHGATGHPEVLQIRSGTSYQPATLRSDANKILRHYFTQIPPPVRAGEQAVHPLGISLSGCLRRITGGRQPLIVDSATYQGRQALVIIAPANGSVPGKVWVAGPECSASAGAIIAQSRL